MPAAAAPADPTVRAQASAGNRRQSRQDRAELMPGPIDSTLPQRDPTSFFSARAITPATAAPVLARQINLF